MVGLVGQVGVVLVVVIGGGAVELRWLLVVHGGREGGGVGGDPAGWRWWVVVAHRGVVRGGGLRCLGGQDVDGRGVVQCAGRSGGRGNGGGDGFGLVGWLRWMSVRALRRRGEGAGVVEGLA